VIGESTGWLTMGKERSPERLPDLWVVEPWSYKVILERTQEIQLYRMRLDGS